MKVVYIFCESGTIRIPFLDYDTRLFSALAVRGGEWDESRSEFSFRGNMSADQFRKNFPDIPFIWVDKNSLVPCRIFNLWEQFLKEAASENPGCAGLSNCAAAAIVQKTAAPSAQLPYAQLPYTQLAQSQKFSKPWETKLETELRSRKYSPKTMRSYIYFNRLLCVTLGKSPEEIQPDDIKKFMAGVEKEKNFSSASMNLAISAIKFFYKNVLKKDIVGEKARPRQDKRLPVVLDKTEINKILSLEKNIKHRLLLMLVYSSGLRVSEVVALKMEHIDLKRKVLTVRLGKGRRDRCTILSEKALSLLSQYCALYDTHDWLFPGQPPTNHLSIRTAQSIFDNAVQNAQILKHVSIHSLRHTFATHLLESGTDIRYIQALLGHASLRTTERYAHVARRSVLNIKSPLDTM